MIKKVFVLSTLFCSFQVMALCQTGNIYTDIACIKKQDAIVKSELSKRNNVLEKKLGASGKASLLKSQKAWIVYRDGQCNVLDTASSMAQGAGSELAHIACIADMNKKRLNEINATIKEISDQ